MPDNSLIDCYCEKFGCSPEEFPEHLLRRCIQTRNGTLVDVIWRLHPDYFKTDLDLIRELGRSTDVEDVAAEISTFRSLHPSRRVLLEHFGVRLSGQLVVNLADELFGKGVIIQPNRPAPR